MNPLQSVRKAIAVTAAISAVAITVPVSAQDNPASKLTASDSKFLPDHARRQLAIDEALLYFTQANAGVQTGRDSETAVEHLRKVIEIAGGYNVPALTRMGISEAVVKRLDVLDAVNSVIRLTSNVRAQLQDKKNAYVVIGFLTTAVNRAGGFENAELKSRGINSRLLESFNKDNNTNVTIEWFRAAKAKLEAGEDPLSEINIMMDVMNSKGGFHIASVVTAGVSKDAIARLDVGGAILTAKKNFAIARNKERHKLNNDVELVAASLAIVRAGGFDAVGINEDEWTKAGGMILPDHGRKAPVPTPPNFNKKYNPPLIAQ